MPAPACEPIDEARRLEAPEALGCGRILVVWLLATLPMLVLARLVAPGLIARSRVPAALVFFFSSSVGMAGPALLAWAVLRRERGAWTAADLCRRLWLQRPRHPRTGQRARAPWLWLAPLGLVATLALLLSHTLVSLTGLLRFLREPAIGPLCPGHAKTLGLMSPELAGHWELVLAVPAVGLLAIASEELLFRGVLLPRMRGRASWLSNAALSSLHFVYVPWMIPGRLLAATGTAWAAHRYRSNWIPALARLPEVAGLAVATLVGVTSSTLPPVAVPFAPRVARSAATPVAVTTSITLLPTCDPTRPGFSAFSIDLRSRDLSRLDLRGRARDLGCAMFDERTVWPGAQRLPLSFDPAALLDGGRDPGLGLRTLHARGITGRGVGIGIIDMPLLPGHEEYASRLRWYEILQSPETPPQPHMHGCAVASIAAGRTVGVAPGADLYFVAMPAESPVTAVLRVHFVAQALRRLIEVNRALPTDRKIRVISLSHGWGAADLGGHDADTAVAQARAEGIAFLSVTHGLLYGGLGRAPDGDPDDFGSYVSCWMCRDDRFGALSRPRLFSIPIDDRTLASPAGPRSMVHFPLGGWSWGPPFVAGTYALAAQVDPAITPERFFAAATRSARRQPAVGVERSMASAVLDPAALVEALRR